MATKQLNPKGVFDPKKFGMSQGIVDLETGLVFVSGQVAGHRARRLIDAPDAAFADPFVLMAEDWTPRGIFAFHPHRGIETVTFVIEGSIEHRDSAGYGGDAGDAQWMTAGRGIEHRPGRLLILCSSG